MEPGRLSDAGAVTGDFTQRYDYIGKPLTADDIGADPLAAIAHWVREAGAAGEPQPNAMCLATVDAAGMPSARTVLLKGIDTGLVFYTSYRSAKARDIAATGRAAANFTWLRMHRQVRVSGTVTTVAAAESDAYFDSRPRGAQIAAAASHQSAPLRDRAELEAAFAAIEAAAAGDRIRRPDTWGGYRLVPDRIEFWHGRENRMHDRLEYTHRAPGWAVQRLAP